MKIGEWTALSNKNIPIQVSLNEPDDYHWHVLQKQLPHVVTGLLDLLHKSEAQIKSISALDVVQLFLPSFLSLILKKSNHGLSQDELLSDSDLENVVIVKALEVFYKMPGSIILAWPHAADFNAQMRIMTAPAYLNVVKKIRVMVPPRDVGQTWQSLSTTITDLSDVEHLFAELFRFCFCPGLSILSLDDDKLRKLSRLFSILGFKRTFTRASGACPVMHMLVDLILGITLVGRLDRPGAFLPSTILNFSSFIFLF
jgi:hypothetical protein